MGYRICRYGDPAAESGVSAGELSADAIAKMVGNEIQKAMEPVMKALGPVMKSRALPGNLNDAAGTVEKQEEYPHSQHPVSGL